MKLVDQFPHEVIENPDLGIVLPDGCRLSARIWRPKGTGPVPAILEYIPYRKRDGTTARDERMHPYFAGHGYAAVRVDMRGNGDSDGLMTDEYTAQELQDAVDVIAWLAAQNWCNGAVGMMGKSWGGFNCLQTAALQPPALKAVVTVCSSVDRFADDIHFKGGCLLGENLGWGAVMLSYSSRPPDPALRADWRAEWLKRLEAQPFLAPRWARHQARDDYWKHGSICEDFAAVKAPVLSFSGWADNYMNTSAKLVDNLPGAKAIIGPWVHQYPHQAVPGPQIGFLQLALRWWDRWLKDELNGAEHDPAYRYWMMDSAPPDACAMTRPGAWGVEQVDRAARVAMEVLPLTRAAGATSALGGAGGALGLTIASPQHLGLTSGEFFPMGLSAEMAGDQRSDDAMSLCFDGTVLDQPLALMGAAELALSLASDKPLGFIVARLCDVAPDGASTRIAHGMLNLCHRDSAEHPSQMVPGQTVEITVVLDQMAYRLAPGHRLRLALSNSYWPFVWPSPEAAQLTLLQGALTLPVHSGIGAEDWLPPQAEAAPEWQHRKQGPAQSVRRTEIDLITGERALVVEQQTGALENLDHGLVTEERMSERWSVQPDAPETARARHVWDQRLSRGDWTVRTRAETKMWADGPDLVMRGWLRAWEGEDLVFERRYAETVPRRFV
jgi:predicted acyl esterase